MQELLDNVPYNTCVWTCFVPMQERALQLVDTSAYSSAHGDVDAAPCAPTGWTRCSRTALFMHLCPAYLHTALRSHYMHVAAFDKVKRPTIYSCLALAHNRNIHDSYTHLVQQVRDGGAGR